MALAAPTPICRREGVGGRGGLVAEEGLFSGRPSLDPFGVRLLHQVGRAAVRVQPETAALPLEAGVGRSLRQAAARVERGGKEAVELAGRVAQVLPCTAPGVECEEGDVLPAAVFRPWTGLDLGDRNAIACGVVQTSMPIASVTEAGNSDGSHCAPVSIPQPWSSLKSRIRRAATIATFVRPFTS